jgi:hypothetical protein
MAFVLRRMFAICVAALLMLSGCKAALQAEGEMITSENFIRIIEKEIIEKDPIRTDALENYGTSNSSWNLTPLFELYEDQIVDNQTLLGLIKENIPLSAEYTKPDSLEGLSADEIDTVKRHLTDYNRDYVGYYSRIFDPIYHDIKGKEMMVAAYDLLFIHSIETGTLNETIEVFLFFQAI